MVTSLLRELAQLIERHTAAFVLRAPAGVPRRAITLSTPATTTDALTTQADITEFVHVCVPAHGYAEIQLTVDGSSSIPGDLATLTQTTVSRQGGIFIASLAEAPEIGPSSSIHAT